MENKKPVFNFLVLILGICCFIGAGVGLYFKPSKALSSNSITAQSDTTSYWSNRGEPTESWDFEGDETAADDFYQETYNTYYSPDAGGGMAAEVRIILIKLQQQCNLPAFVLAEQ